MLNLGVFHVIKGKNSYYWENKMIVYPFAYTNVASVLLIVIKDTLKNRVAYAFKN